MKKEKYLLVDLFAGCGGLSTGMEQAGFTPWFVNEIVPTFCNTYKCNHKLPDRHYYIGDILLQIDRELLMTLATIYIRRTYTF